MSNAIRQIVEETVVRPFERKAVLLHIADTVRDGEWLYFRSNNDASMRLGMSSTQVLRRHLVKLEQAGLIDVVGEREVNGGKVKEWRLNVEALLGLPCIYPEDRRRDYLRKPVKGGGAVVTGGEVMRAPGGGNEGTTNHREPYLSINAAEKKRADLRLVRSAREPEHLKDDPDFAAFVAEQEAGR